MILRNKAQSLLEYAALIIIVLGAFLAMRVYFQRAMHERSRQSADVLGQGEQYEPGVTVESNKQ